MGDGVRVVAIRAAVGGTSTAVHLLTFRRPGAILRAVMKRFVNAAWLAAEPDVPGREASALELLAGSGVPAPRLLAADLVPEWCDVPTVLMSYVPGRPRASRSSVAPPGTLRSLAEMLARIHRGAMPDTLLPAYRPWYLDEPQVPPSWTRDPDAWREAFRISRRPPPVTRRALLHRDFNPWNVLWRGGRISGVIDWANACIGPPEVDVAHMRTNLVAIGGLALADAFLGAWRDATGSASYDPYWDIVSAVDWISDMDPARPATQRALDAHLVRAVRGRS
jgi:aminoglycoside phosphotransferase (APT) family kinase protein